MDNSYFNQYPEAEIDLHGLTRDEALSELSHFISWARQQDFHYIRIITGKGTHSFDSTPVIRNAVVAFLNSTNLPYSYGGMFEGGEGVVCVELKK